MFLTDKKFNKTTIIFLILIILLITTILTYLLASKKHPPMPTADIYPKTSETDTRNPSVPHDINFKLDRTNPQKELAIPIFINTDKMSINAIAIYLKFDPAYIKVNSISSKGSFIKYWVSGQPTFSNNQGKISLVGGIPTPGFNGNGEIGRINLIPLIPGSTQLVYEQNTQALINDGLGTPIPLNLTPIKLNIEN